MVIGVLTLLHRRRVCSQADELSSKQLIRAIVILEQELALQQDESRLSDDDLDFLRSEPRSVQDNWSIDTSALAFPTDDDDRDAGSADPVDINEMAARTEAENTHEPHRDVTAWLQEFLLPQRDLDTYYFSVMEGVTRALVSLQIAKPSSDDAAVWLIAFLRDEQAAASSESDAPAHSQSSPPKAAHTSTLSLFFKTNYELMRRIDHLKCEQSDMHARLERLQTAHAQLADELSTRTRFIAKLSESHVTTRTHAIMDGTPVFLDSQKHWVLPGMLLVPTKLSDAELLGLRRAESYLMQQDEVRWRFLITAQARYDASVLIQSAWRCARGYRVYKALTKQRRAAAVVIQRNYFHYLFHRAVSVPEWCVVGREVLVAPSVAYKCGISFQFYPKKDFPTGNYRRLPAETMTIEEMMEVCRQDEECAGFSTDGAMKRFLPRKLSQLKDMNGGSEISTRKHGLYVKVHPLKSDAVVNTGIIVAVPDDRFGLVDVVLDGTGVLERVPLGKLSDRWKRIRIRLKKKRERRVKRTFVFGKVKDDSDALDGGADEVCVDLSSNNASAEFDMLDEDEEERVQLEAERKRRRRLRATRQDNTVGFSNQSATVAPTPVAAPLAADEDEDELLEYLYEDQATKRVLRREPQRTFSDPETRARVIAKRKQEFQDAKALKDAAKKLESVVRLQCAWRSKRAREAFRQVIRLRAKEKEREQLVQQVHATATTHKRSNHHKTPGGSNFFTRLFKR